MQDNYESTVSVRANSPWLHNPYANCGFNPYASSDQDPCLAQWQYDDIGPYGEGAAPLAIAFRSSVSKTADADILFYGGANGNFRGHFPGFSQAHVPNTTFFWAMARMQVTNQAGTLRLRSTDPRDTPIIDFNFFHTNSEEDLQALEEGTRFALQLFDNFTEPYTPFKVDQPNLNIDLRQAIKDRVFSHHVTSTCRMGPKDSSEYCVDSEFKVNGVDALRVVDASIFPRTPGAFPVAPTLVIGQKAFRVIAAGLK